MIQRTQHFASFLLLSRTETGYLFDKWLKYFPTSTGFIFSYIFLSLDAEKKIKKKSSSRQMVQRWTWGIMALPTGPTAKKHSRHHPRSLWHRHSCPFHTADTRQPSSQCTGMVSIHTTFWGWHPIREPVLLPIQTSANVLGWESSTGQPMCLGACIHVRHPEKGLGSWLQPFLRTAAKADEMGERYTPHYEPHCAMACALSARLPF